MPVGNLNEGNPWGILATRSISGLATATITEATTTAVKAAGSLGIKRWMAKISSRAPTPITVAVQFQSPDLGDGRPQLLEGVAVGDLNAKQLAKLADDDLDRHAGDEAGHDGLRHKVGDPAHTGQTGHDKHHPGGDRQGSGHGHRRVSGHRPSRPPTTLAETAATEPAAANTSSFDPPNRA